MKFELDYDVVDAIVLKGLKDHRKMVKKSLKDHLENGTWMHEDDVVYNVRLIKAMEVVIDYYGG